MSSLDPIEDKIMTFIMRHYPLARKKKVDESTPLLEIGVIDSLGVIDLVTFMEDTFFISVTDSEITSDNFRTIRDLTAFVYSKSGAVARKAA